MKKNGNIIFKFHHNDNGNRFNKKIFLLSGYKKKLIFNIDKLI